MSTFHDGPAPARRDIPAPEAGDDWVPEDREPSTAENNFMSFALFGVLILFGVGCLVLL